MALYKASEDPTRHFTIGELTSLSREAFIASVKGEMGRAETFRGHCFVYVHGYRNTFEDAIFRTAQLAADMKFDGGIFAFSWPSQGTVAGYLTDRDAADSSQLAFKEFVETVSKRATCFASPRSWLHLLISICRDSRFRRPCFKMVIGTT